VRDIHHPLDPGEPADWFHYVFDVTAAQTTDSDRLRIVAKAEVGNAVAGVGLEFERSGWNRDQVYPEVWFSYGWGALFSIGAESDVFAGLLSREIGDGRGGRFVGLIEADVVMLNSEPEAMLAERCYTKFFLGEADDSVAQVFINFDIPSGVVEFKEKDLDYRSNLLTQLVVH